MNTRVVFGLSVAAIAATAGCGGGGTANTAAKTGIGAQSGDTGARVVATSTKTPTATTTVGNCETKNLSFSLGRADGAAGSVYEPLQLTNKGSSACTLFGYPGVSFVTTGSGSQVGKAASRNPQHAATRVTLAPGASAESIVQVVNHMNYSPGQCKATDVSGFRVYPPGETAAAYVPFDAASSACSTDVTQLTVEAVAVTGS